MRFQVNQKILSELLQKYQGANKVILDTIKRTEDEFNKFPDRYILKEGRVFIEEVKEFIGFIDNNKATLKDLYEIYQRNLHIEDTNRVDVVLATALSRKLPLRSTGQTL